MNYFNPYSNVNSVKASKAEEEIVLIKLLSMYLSCKVTITFSDMPTVFAASLFSGMYRLVLRLSCCC